ncbi:hypothetical protein SFRURICE_009030, partial [Spodoptera frugiperda]
MCYKSHVIGGEPIAIYRTQFRATTENFSKYRKKPSYTLPDPGIETPCPVVALATTRPTRHNTSPDPGIEPETPCPAVTLATTRPTRQSIIAVYICLIYSSQNSRKIILISNKAEYPRIFVGNKKSASLVEVVASATAGQGVSGSIPGSGEVLLSLFRFFENFSVVARSLEMCP